MIYLLYVASGYLIITSFILLRNRQNFTSLSPAERITFTAESPKVSLCIPARNEESNIRRCVETALDQRYPHLEVLVLDDQSTDKTGAILSSLKQNHPRSENLVLLKGKPKPADWLGKPWACQQLAEAAEGEILIFADADTWFEKQTVGRVVRTMGRDVVDMVTVWPRQVLGSFWEKMLIPLVYYALLSLLPVHYVFRAPRWMPPFLYSRVTPLFAAACGQFMAFKANSYHKIGGHQSVKSQVVEDVALAKKIKSAGLSMRMYYGSRAVGCRMYRSEKEIREGFRKNFLAGFGYRLPFFGLMGLLHLLVYVYPFVMLAWAISAGSVAIFMWAGIPVLLILAHRFLLARWFGWNPLYGLLHPVSVLWFQLLAVISAKDYLGDSSVTWKGRSI
ncbi:glycosyltransferase [Halalkalibaculum sp. DA384]|uniref:glycosyltransferase n=1 Tax=Halalkalibaculum sp. DA384 TaxID=3373606 RepID=UPI0037549C7F